PRSFKDNTGNGIGDLKGIIEKLDYLKELGVETVWFSPFFESPQRDHGYDIINFRAINSEYGTMQDFETLLKKMHDRNMKMVVDFVLNHTSVDHPWFKESASNKDNPKRNWYIWRDGKKSGGKKPPNNWKTMTGGRAWLYYENTNQWVYFHFLPSMIDLNYRNPEVKNEMFNTMRFWLDKGVDGFRLDILHAIYEDEQLRDDKFCFQIFPSDKNTAALFRQHKYDLNLPETYDFSMELRRVMDEYRNPERFLVGEVFGSIEDVRKYYGPNNNGLHTTFLFEFITAAISFKPQKIAKVISRIENSLPSPYTPTYVYGNHDRPRYVSFLKNDVQKAKLLATMQLTLRGVPFIYYGEEIGMPNVKIKLKESQDPIGQKYAKFPISQITSLFGISLTRDGCRTPMQWTPEQNAGFSTNKNVKPWLKISDTYKKINVEVEEVNPNSLLNCYKKLLKIRNKFDSLQKGELEFLNLGKLNEKCLAFRRIHEAQELNIFLNFSKDSFNLQWSKQDPKLLFSTIPNKNMLEYDSQRNSFKLDGYEGLILE
ncbi:MAG TPA: alpha-glucosidase, partial [Candidatus Lokiarchaeia archaeon]